MNAGEAVAVSPHLDDAVFSAGGTIAALVAAGWRVRVITCFTATVLDPSPFAPSSFALSTQLDKGIAADVDYLALRRAEDAAACAVLGAQPVHLPLPEAPHRGYTSAAALFTGVRPDDNVAPALRAALEPHLHSADLVLAPQAIGDHADHRVVAELIATLRPDALWWRDVPYILRQPGAARWRGIPAGTEQAVDVGPHLDAKIAAARCYATQLGFQFGGREHVATHLRELAATEARRVGATTPSEVLTAPIEVINSYERVTWGRNGSPAGIPFSPARTPQRGGPMRIDSVLPNRASPGHSVIIQGEGLETAEQVFFGDEKVSFDIDGATLVVVVPDDVTGTVEVTVEGGDGTSDPAILTIE